MLNTKVVAFRLLRNARCVQKKPFKLPKFDPEKFREAPNPDIGKDLPSPPGNFDMSPEVQEKFLAALGPELQDIYHKGAVGELDDHAISKYMRNMTPEEIQRITESPAFADFLQSDPRFSIPPELDPDNPKSQEDTERLSNINWNDLSRGQNNNDEEGGEGEGGLSDIDKEKVRQIFEQFEAQQKKDRLKFGDPKEKE
jgi:hypothetical protein